DLGDLVFPTPLVPDVIAKGDRVHPALEDGPGQGSRDARAGGGIFAVGHDEVDRVLAPEPGHPVEHDVAPGPADDVPDKEQLEHGPNVRAASGGANFYLPPGRRTRPDER